MNEVQTRVGFESIERINKQIHWLDEFILSISTLLIGLALMLAFADLGTGGLIFQNQALLIGWGVAIGLGVESQLRALVRRAYNAFKERAWIRGLGWTIIATGIAAVSVVAMVIFSTEKMLGLSESQALNMVGITAVTYAQARAILTVVLAVISGFAAYEMRVAKPDTAAQLAQIRHEKALLPDLIELDAMKAQRAQQADALKVQRGVNVVATAASEIRNRGKGQTGMALMPAMSVVDADDDGDDEPTPPRGGPRRPVQRGRRIEHAQILPPAQVAGIQVAQITNPLKLERVNAAKELLAVADRPLKLREIADHVDGLTGQPMKSTATQMGVRNIALNQLAAEGRLPAWAKHQDSSAA